MSPQISEESFDKMKQYCHDLNSWDLAALESIACAAKSTSLAVALLEGAWPLNQIIEYSRIEEQHNIEQYGYVEGAHDIDESNTTMTISAAKILHDLVSLK